MSDYDARSVSGYRVEWRSDLTTNWCLLRKVDTAEEAMRLLERSAVELQGQQARIIEQRVVRVEGLGQSWADPDVGWVEDEEEQPEEQPQRLPGEAHASWQRRLREFTDGERVGRAWSEDGRWIDTDEPLSEIELRAVAQMEGLGSAVAEGLIRLGERAAREEMTGGDDPDVSSLYATRASFLVNVGWRRTGGHWRITGTELSGEVGIREALLYTAGEHSDSRIRRIARALLAEGADSPEETGDGETAGESRPTAENEREQPSRWREQ